MALTTTWKGHLKISLVSFPVRLYAAVGSAKKLALNQLHKQCRSRIHLDTFCPEHGKLVPFPVRQFRAVRIKNESTYNHKVFEAIPCKP